MELSKKQKRDFAAIANFRDKNEKASWIRKKKNIESLVSDLEPIEEAIRELNNKRAEILEDIRKIRDSMDADCIHPQDYLVHYERYVKCRFCETNISIPKTS